MGHGVDVGNVIVGFGGVFLLGVIGFLVVWFSKPDEEDDAGADHDERGTDSVHGVTVRRG
jgi:hypothetical protein